MDYLIRKAKAGDETALAYIQTESWKAAFNNILSKEILQKSTEINGVVSMYNRLLDEGIGNGYIMEVNGKPQCIAWWDKARDDDLADYAELLCIHSLQNKWRNGYGTKMIEKVLNDMKEAGYEKVILWVFTDNDTARKFYTACGFITYGRIKRCFGTQEICYERNL